MLTVRPAQLIPRAMIVQFARFATTAFTCRPTMKTTVLTATTAVLLAMKRNASAAVQDSTSTMDTATIARLSALLAQRVVPVLIVQQASPNRETQLFALLVQKVAVHALLPPIAEVNAQTDSTAKILNAWLAC